MHFRGPIIRPPTDANSLFIEVTAGCSHNACTFCNFYDETPFWVAPLEQIEADLKEAKQYWPDATDIWASGGNPFVLSTERQIQVWDLMRRYYPEARISTYATVSDFRDKTVEDIRCIKEHGLDEIMIGIESGDDEVLRAVNKGYTSADILAACGKADQAGITYRMIYLGGLAGRGKLVASARKSAAIINQINPYYMILTNVAILPGTPLYEEREQGLFQEATEKERLEEIRALIEDLTIPITVNTGTSASSVFFVADLPEDKEATLQRLDRVIESFSATDEEVLGARRRRMDHV